MTRKLIPALTVVAALAAGAACGHQENKTGPAAAKASPVQTMTIEPQTIRETVDLPAKVQPDPTRVIHVYPPAGGRLMAVSVHPGDTVRKGQTIAIEESSDVAQARSDYTRAQAEFDKNDRALQRSKLLFDHKVLSEREYEEAEADDAEAKSELQRAKGRLEILGVPVEGNSNQVAMVAPRSGVVVDTSAAAGELAKSTDNANAIATIADLSSVWVVGDAYEKDLSALRSGEPVLVTVAAYPGEQWKGKLANISDEVDPQTRTLKVRVVLQNPKLKLKPEMFATIRIERAPQQAIVIPVSALLREGGDTLVLVQTKPGSYERRLVTLRSSDAHRAIIASGLKAGEVIVSEGATLVRGGDEGQ